ncbi:hypothetical protein PRUPE_4G040100 [Prunus persica]|uniref:Uncharacterized protein n=1 Tax=Prunus persica TaxID=3760 RepID=A0A251PFE0_PRUPE|nr:uncharacterized protein LOC18781018 [Prunus persica]ONI10314.1 hypothetical protein PRUPE_4G040100 [Prunus persica]
MVVVKEHSFEWPPIGAPLNMQRDEHPGSPPAFNSSVNAVSFGFVATAILISMFLVMAIFERFLRPTSSDLTPSGRRRSGDLEAQLGFNGKLSHPSPKMTVYASGVSVLMPGDDIPTFIAHPAPVPCPPERICLPQHQHISLPNPNPNPNPTSNSNSNSNMSSNSS